MTELFFIRHGETEANANIKFTGRYDSLLTEKGIIQAEMCKKFVSGVDYDCIFSSPLKRAIKTAEVVNVKGKPIIIDERLYELDGGIWNGLYYSEVKKNYPDLFSVYKNDLDNFKAINGESVKEVLLRLKDFIDFVKSDYSGKKVCIVSHAICIRTIFAYFMNKRVQDIDFPTNASVSVLKYDNDKLRELIYSSDAHIGDFTTNIKL